MTLGRKSILACLFLVGASCFGVPAPAAESSSSWFERFNHAVDTQIERSTKTKELRSHSKELCALISEVWIDDLDIDPALGQLDATMKKINASLSSGSGIRRGYVFYYFSDPNSSVSNLRKVESAINAHVEDMAKQLRSTQYEPGLTLKRASIKDNLLRIEVDADYSVIDLYSRNGTHSTPSSAIADTPEGSGLKFEHSERRDAFGYAYSRELPSFTEKLRSAWRRPDMPPLYFSIWMNLTGVPTQDGGWKKVELDRAECEYPMWDASWGSGEKPAQEVTYPQKPVALPCSEVMRWYACHVVEISARNDNSGRTCKGVPKERPVCGTTRPKPSMGEAK